MRRAIDGDRLIGIIDCIVKHHNYKNYLRTFRCRKAEIDEKLKYNQSRRMWCQRVNKFILFGAFILSTLAGSSFLLNFMPPFYAGTMGLIAGLCSAVKAVFPCHFGGTDQQRKRQPWPCRTIPATCSSVNLLHFFLCSYVRNTNFSMHTFRGTGQRDARLNDHQTTNFDGAANFAVPCGKVIL